MWIKDNFVKVKRIILAILSFFYLATATGSSLHFHYCMGQLASWSFSKNEQKECEQCGMEKNLSDDIGCCKDEYKQLKLQVDQKLTHESSLYVSLPVIELIAGFHNDRPLLLTIRESFFPNRFAAFKGHSSIAAYILLCNFRI